MITNAVSTCPTFVDSCSCVTCCCYKLLENPTISHMKSKSTRDAIIHVLGIMVKKYNHILGRFICTHHTPVSRFALVQMLSRVVLNIFCFLHRSMCEGDSALAALRAAAISMCSSCGFLELRVWGQGHRRRNHEVKLKLVILCWYDSIYYVMIYNDMCL